MNTNYSKQLNKLLEQTQKEAHRLKSAQVEPAHLLLGMLKMEKSEGCKLLLRQGADVNNLAEQTEQWILSHVQRDQELNVGTSVPISQRSEKLLRLSVLESMLRHAGEVNTEHLLLAIMRERDNEAYRMLARENMSYNGMREIVDGQGVADDEEGETIGAGQDVPVEPASDSSPSKKKSGTPMLDNYGRDLTKMAREGLLDPVVGRETEILRVSQILSRRKKNNPILIGQPGVGKSAIVEGLAMRIVNRQVARVLFDKRIISLDLAAVVAGTKYRGQFEERIRNIVKEVQQNRNIVLFIDEIHTIIGAGSAAGTMDAANMLKPALSRGGLQCIGATTLDEYRKSIEKDGALERRFQKVIVEPTSVDETIQILHNLRSRYEEHHNVKFTDAALEACVRLTDRYIADRSFPDKAIDAMDESGARVHITSLPVNETLTRFEAELAVLEHKKEDYLAKNEFNAASEVRGQIVTLQEKINAEQMDWEKTLDVKAIEVNESNVADVVAQMTGIPVQRIGQSETERLRTMDSILKQSVVGQDDAVQRIVRAIQRSRVGLKDPNRPIGTFMFLGPTGVGKTYLTKCLAEVLFGSKDSMIRVDMSEYMEKHTVSRLVGAPPGYVGYEEGGQLTEQVRRHPYSIVLLDEIEKAHPDVYNILLQVMDEGRMTDGYGATIDFKNTIIIMTSNCGTRQLKEFGSGIGFGAAERALNNKSGRDVIQKALNKQFAPEFLNRIDEIVFFDQLSKDSILEMVTLALKPIAKRVEEMGYHLTVDDAARAVLADKGYDVQFGARPLARSIQSNLEDAICDLVMRGEIERGQTIAATAVDGKIVVSKE